MLLGLIRFTIGFIGLLTCLLSLLDPPSRCSGLRNFIPAGPVEIAPGNIESEGPRVYGSSLGLGCALGVQGYIHVYIYIYMYMMHGFYLRSGQLVNGKLVSVLSFSKFWCMCCRHRFS